MIRFKDFVIEGKTDKFKAKKTYKKGDIIETNHGKYYVNGVPDDLMKLWKDAKSIELQEWEFAKRKINIVNAKYFTEDTDVAAETRSWFNEKQPTENQVRNAMIWSYDQFGDYQIKSGGGSDSDHVYVSHFKTTIANPTSGNDQDVIILKKFSTVFNDVLVTIDEIQELQDLTEIQKVRDYRRYDNLRGIVSVLIRHEAGWPVSDKKKVPKEWIDNLYTELIEEYDKVEVNKYLDELIDKIKEDMGREIMVFDKEKNDYVNQDLKDKDTSHEEKKLKAIQKIKLKI